MRFLEIVFLLICLLVQMIELLNNLKSKINKEQIPSIILINSYIEIHNGSSIEFSILIALLVSFFLLNTKLNKNKKNLVELLKNKNREIKTKTKTKITLSLIFFFGESNNLSLHWRSIYFIFFCFVFVFVFVSWIVFLRWKNDLRKKNKVYILFLNPPNGCKCSMS